MAREAVGRNPRRLAELRITAPFVPSAPMAGGPQRCAIDDVLADDRRAALARDADAGLDVDCAGAPRLAAKVLATLTTGAFANARVRLIGAPIDARLGLAALGLDRLLPEAERVPPPAAIAAGAFTARVDGAVVVIEVDRQAGDDTRVSQAQSHRWIAGIVADQVVIDFARLEHVNSTIVAWLLQLVQAAKPAAFELRHVHRQVATQLTQLRLNHLLTVRDS